jgi:hypothetical protein
MKSEGAELLFKLRGDRTSEGEREMYGECARAAASFPQFGAAEALGSFAFDAATLESFRHTGEQIAEAVAALARTGEALRGAVAHDLDGFAFAVETIRARGAEWHAIALEAGRLIGRAGAFADGYGFAAARAAFGDGCAGGCAVAATLKRPARAEDAAPQMVDEPEGVM